MRDLGIRLAVPVAVVEVEVEVEVEVWVVPAMPAYERHEHAAS